MGITRVCSGALGIGVVAATLALAACGGGGDAGSSGGTPNPGTGNGTNPNPNPNPAPSANEPPVIASPPQPQSIAAGGAATFAVTSSNATTYRWQVSVDDGATWTDVAGATGASLALPKVVLADTGRQYRVLLNNANGTTTSGAATLSIKPNVRLLAGALGGYGFQDGPPSQSRVNGPRGVAVDRAGNVYVADGGNAVIRRIAPDGTMTTVAGTPGQPGRVDGPAASAKFDDPRSVAVDGNGVLWVVDQGSCWLRRIADGRVTSFADLGGSNCYRMGTQSPTQFNPTEVAVGPAGDVFVSDDIRHVIRRIDANGAVSVHAGVEASSGTEDGPRNAARFDGPRGLAFDATGNLYVADRRNHSIRRIAPDGTVTTFAGLSGVVGHVDAPGNAARFISPYGVAVSGSDLVVVDPSAMVVRRIQLADASVTTLAGGYGQSGYVDGSGAAARFDSPMGIAADAAGFAYVADTNNNMIRRVSAAGMVVRSAGQPNPAAQTDGAGAAARFTWANGITADAAGNVYAAEWYGSTIRRIAPGGSVTTLAGKAGEFGSVDGAAADARFDVFSYIAAAPDGSVYVTQGESSYYDCVVRRVMPSGQTLTVAGLRGGCGTRDGNFTVAEFLWPSGIAVNAAGTVAVTEGNFTCAIRQIVGGIVSTLVDRATCEVRDGAAGVARVALPRAPVYEASGALVFSDARTMVRRLKADGSIETIAGSTEAGNADGVGAAARFQDITGIAVDSAGRIYVADAGNHSVRLIETSGRVRTLIPLNVGPRVVLGEGGSLNAPFGIAVLPGGEVAVSTEFAVIVD